MRFLDKTIDKRINKFIYEFTGENIIPEFHLPCTSSISIGWDGFCAIDYQSIWLVNKFGARGVAFENITPGDNWGQFPYGSAGFPKYRFELIFKQSIVGFTIYPKTAIGGAELNQRLNKVFENAP